MIIQANTQAKIFLLNSPQLLDMVEERRKMESHSQPKEDLSRMMELLQMVDEGPRYDQ